MASLGTRDIPIDELRFDPDNPRIPPDLDGRDDQAVLDWMLTDAGLVELMGSIAVNGFFPAEPLLVASEHEDGQPPYIVLEGNRRLAAVRLLLDPKRAPRRKSAVAGVAAEVDVPEQLEQLPCAVFEFRQDVLDYLGYRHITGIKEWEPSAKARYMQELYEEHIADSGAGVYRKIARIIGSRSDYVMRLLGSLRLYEQISEDIPSRDELDLESLSFSLLTLALNYASIINYLGLESLVQESFEDLNLGHLDNLAVWMFRENEDGNSQLGESRNMKLLAAAVSKEAGLRSLERGDTVAEAALAALDVSELLLRLTRQANTQLLSAQRYIHQSDVNDAFYTAQGVLAEILELVDAMLVAARRRESRGSARV